MHRPSIHTDDTCWSDRTVRESSFLTAVLVIMHVQSPLSLSLFQASTPLANRSSLVCGTWGSFLAHLNKLVRNLLARVDVTVVAVEYNWHNNSTEVVDLLFGVEDNTRIG